MRSYVVIADAQGAFRVGGTNMGVALMPAFGGTVHAPAGMPGDYPVTCTPIIGGDVVVVFGPALMTVPALMDGFDVQTRDPGSRWRVVLLETATDWWQPGPEARLSGLVLPGNVDTVPNGDPTASGTPVGLRIPIQASYTALRLVALEGGKLIAYRRYAEVGDVELEYGEWNGTGSKVLEVPCAGRREYLMVAAPGVTSVDLFAEATIGGV